MDAREVSKGDWDVRGPDFETLLVGPITPTIIDADRFVRREWSNGFPNWAMYRCAYAGDSHLLGELKDWCIALAVAYGESGAIRKPDDTVAVCVGRDVWHALVWKRWGAPGDEIAAALGIAPKTYRKFRVGLYKRLKASLDEYWIRLQIEMRRVALLERREEAPAPLARVNQASPDQPDLKGNGCYRTPPRFLRE